MSLTFLGWLSIVSSIAISALLIFLLRSDAARLALLSRLRPSSWGGGQGFRGTAGTLIVVAAVFLLVAGIGAATFYLGDPPEATGSGESNSGSDGEIARLKDYARSIGAGKPASTAEPGKPLLDVNTMIERLAARLETAPEDVKGWRMLGWSYFHTGRYKEAASAWARAVELDPNSAELKLAYEEAKAKASDNSRQPRLCKQETGEKKRCLGASMILQSRRWLMAWQIAWRGLRETSTAGLALCALELCLVRERSRQQRSARRLRSSRTTRQHRARLRLRRSSSA